MELRVRGKEISMQRKGQREGSDKGTILEGQGFPKKYQTFATNQKTQATNRTKQLANKW